MRVFLGGKPDQEALDKHLASAVALSSVLDQDIENLNTELGLRHTLAGNAAMAIVERHSNRAADSRSIFEAMRRAITLMPFKNSGAMRHESTDLAAAAVAV